VPSHPVFQQLNEFPIHELIVVGNVQNVQRCIPEGITMLFGKSRSVMALHDEHNVRPFQVRRTQLAPGLFTEAAGPDSQSRIILKHPLGCRASPLIP
jgi:hypothetical protein